MIKSFSGQFVFCFAILRALLWQKLIIPVYTVCISDHINKFCIVYCMTSQQQQFFTNDSWPTGQVTDKNFKNSPTPIDRTFPRKGIKEIYFQRQYCFIFQNEHK